MPATWTADDVLAMARSYQNGCVLVAGAEVGVFDALAEAHSASAGELAKRLDADLRGMTILLDALAALGLLVKTDERYALAPGAAELLTARGAQSVQAMILHQGNCLRRWSRLAEVVRSGSPVDVAPSVRGADADHAAFITAMDNISGPVADRIVGDLQPLPFRHLLDVGGASGTWTLAFLRTDPQARATIFDLPHVLPFARQRIAAGGMSDRVDFAGGDFLSDSLPSGADLAWVSAIVHQNSRAQNRQMFQAIAAALAPGGAVLVRDMVMEESHTAPPAGALFAVNMLVATQAGGTFTLRELSEDLHSAGFGAATLLRRDEGMHAVVGAKKR